MNKEIIYIDGKAIVKDEEGVLRQIDFYDNIEEILNQENLIEIMEDKISVLEKKSKDYKKKKYIPYMLPTIILTALIFPNLIIGLATNETGPILIETIFGKINFETFFTIISLGVGIPLGSFLECMNFISHKQLIKEQKGIISSLEFLKKEIELEKKHLSELKEVKNKTEQDNNFGTINLNNSQGFEYVERATNFTHELGVKSNKYYKYYKKGKLDKKLKKAYTDEEIEIIKDYLVENEHLLSSKPKIRTLKKDNNNVKQ